MPKEKFSEADLRKIEQSIALAEKNTSGEIRLFVEDNCKGNVLDRAAFIFHKLGMDKTKLRNGVLFYLAMESHHFAILGDRGINEKTGKDFWHEIKLLMQGHFTEGDFVTGLSKGIQMSGEALKVHFPYTSGDRNELSDEIVFGSEHE